MEINNKNVYIIGPSNACVSNLWKYGSITEEDYSTYVSNIANIVNDNCSSVGCIPDTSVPYDIVKQISLLPNKKIKTIGFYPKYGDYTSIKDKADEVDEMREVDGGWAVMNTEISKQFDIIICCGLSGGVFSEIAHTKIHRIWGKKDIPILIDERTISGPLNAELEADTNIKYFSSDEELYELLNSKGV